MPAGQLDARRLLDEDPAERAVAAADAGARWARVMDAIGTLPEAERQVLLLFAWEELSYDEIALCASLRATLEVRNDRRPGTPAPGSSRPAAT